jgi:hypothetical protein
MLLQFPHSPIFCRPSPLKRKVKPKAPPKNKRRKASGNKYVEANDSDASGSLAHSHSDEDVKSGMVVN